jgi:rRNA maturation protein Rpf1
LKTDKFFKELSKLFPDVQIYVKGYNTLGEEIYRACWKEEKDVVIHINE